MKIVYTSLYQSKSQYDIIIWGGDSEKTLKPAKTLKKTLKPANFMSK